MKNKTLITLLLTLIIGLKQTHAQFYNQGSEVTIQAGATVMVEGDFYNKAGSDFKNAGSLAIKNYVTNDQAMTSDHGGYWIFNGTNTQKIGGLQSIWMNTLRFDNPAGFLLQTSLILSKQLEFNTGVMTAENPGNIVQFTPSAAIGSPAPSHTSHINGEVIKEGNSQIFTYPVGDGTKYQPIEVNFATNENGLLGKYNPSDAGAASFGGSGSEATLLNNYNSKEHWDLKPINNGATKATVKVFWDSYRDGFSEGASLRRVAHLSTLTGKWENEGTNGGVGSAMAGSVISNTVTSWSPFTLGTVAGIPLPITLINFKGKKVGNYNQLNWQTNQEINASHFEIERSSDAKEFEKIGELKATNKIFAETYEFHDRTPLSGRSDVSAGGLYRLKLVDLDGKFDYSKIIYIENTSDNELVGAFYPNPAINNQSNIDINLSEKGNWVISTLDLAGRVLKTESRVLEKGLNSLRFENFQKGLNIIQFESNGKVIVRKLLR